MTISRFQFERTELRVLQARCADNEEFLNRVADMIGNLTVERNFANLRAELAEDRIRVIENSL